MDYYKNNFQKALYQGNDILQLIPQREPIVMVDRFFGIIDKKSFSSLTVTEDNIFCKNGKLTEEGVIEHFAQSAAARIGYIFVQKNEVVPIGFIGSVSKFSLHNFPQIGEEIKTVVTIIQEVGNITLARVKSWVDDMPIADGELKIFLKRE